MPAELTGRWRDLVLLGTGAAVGLGQAPFGLPAVALPALAVGVLLALRAGPVRRAARAGWLLGAGYFALSLHWIVEPFLVDAARHGWMAPFALLLLAGGMALFWAVAFGSAVWLASSGGPWRRACALCVTFTLLEMLRAVLFTGFPWGMLATLWADTPLRGLAAFTGPYGLSALTVLTAALLAEMLRTRRPLPGLLAAVVLGAGWGAGTAYLAGLPKDAPADAPLVRVVQPNAAQDVKWRSDMIPVFWNRMLTLSAGPGARRPDVVIWPEVALPYLWNTAPDGDAQIARAAQGAVAILGAQRFEGDELRNSVGVLDAAGHGIALYDKHHLVPFGEYVPGGALAARLGLAGLATGALGGFSPGPGPALLDLRAEGLGRVLPLICYEVIFPRHAFSPGPRADWMVQLTNDAWFGNFAGPQQHLDQARMRAVEQGLPLVRAANTGISAVIDPAGRLVTTLPLNTDGALDAALPAPAPVTVYARWGNAPILAVLAVLALVLGVLRRRGLDLSGAPAHSPAR